MSDVERILEDLDGFTDKAKYLSGAIIERYDLDKGGIKTQNEALIFAYGRKEMGMEMEILEDFIRAIRQSVHELREAVGA